MNPSLSQISIEEASLRNPGFPDDIWNLLVEEPPNLVTQISASDNLDPPQLFYIDSDEFEAYASSENKIWVSLGIVRLCVQIEAKVFDADVLSKDKNDNPAPLLIPRIMLIWTWLHEYSHISAGHFYLHKKKVEERVLEFDADRLASLMTYSLMRQIAIDSGRFDGDDDFRMVFIASLFWPIRLEFSSNPISHGDHPTWYSRIFHILKIVERLTEAKKEGMSLIPGLSKFMLAAFDTIAQLDKIYIDMIGTGEGKGNFIMKLTDESLSGSEYYYLSSERAKLAPLFVTAEKRKSP